MAFNVAYILPVLVATLVYSVTAQGDTCDVCECRISNIQVLSQLIDSRVNDSIKARIDVTVGTTVTSKVNTKIESIGTDERIRDVINTSAAARIHNMFGTRPVIKMLYIAVNYYSGAGRVVYLRRFNLSTFALSDGTLSTFYIYNTAVSYTSNDQLLAYRPSIGGMATLYINLDAVIPCFSGRTLKPVCSLFSYEDDHFQKGKPFVQAAGNSSNFQIFDSGSSVGDVETFGFGVMGCGTFDRQCVGGIEVSLVCLLPRGLCG